MEVGLVVIIIGAYVEFMIYLEFITIVECVVFCVIDWPMVERADVGWITV